MKEFQVPLSAEKCGFMMNFPDKVASEVLELSARFSEIVGEHVDFPNTVIMCISWVHGVCFNEGGDADSAALNYDCEVK